MQITHPPLPQLLTLLSLQQPNLLLRQALVQNQHLPVQRMPYLVKILLQHLQAMQQPVLQQPQRKLIRQQHQLPMQNLLKQRQGCRKPMQRLLLPQQL